MEQQLTATSILSLFETDKQQRETFTSQVIEAVREGAADPLQIQLQLKCTEDMIKQITASPEYKEALLTRAQQYGKSFQYHNATFETRETGVVYDYSKSEDVVYNDLCAQMEMLKTRIKEREKFLQNIPESGIADPDNGNMIYRAPKSSTTAVAVKLK